MDECNDANNGNSDQCQGVIDNHGSLSVKYTREKGGSDGEK